MSGKDDGSGQGAGRWLDGATDHGRRALRHALDEAPGLGDPALSKQRVWNRVQEPWVEEPAPRRPARWPRLLAGTAAAAAIGVAGLVAFQYRAELLPATDGVVATRPAAPSAPVAVQTPSQSGALNRAVPVTTGPGERARHRLARGVDVELAPRSALVPGDEQAAPEVKVGRVRFSVPRQAPERRYVVRAGAYRVVVLGTTFEVSVEEKGVGVAVESGVVEIAGEVGGADRLLGRIEAGGRWSSEGAVAPAAGPARRALAAAIEPKDPAAARALDEARRARKGGDPGRALELYGRLAEQGGPLAESARYEMGAIYDEDLHDPRRALGVWEDYRERHPKGLLRAEADLSIIEVMSRLGDKDRAREEALAFLRRHPRNERRGEVALVAAGLELERGGCAAAVPLFEAAAASRLSAADTDEVVFRRAACLASLRDGRADDLLREYLARFPAGRHAAEAQRLLGAAAGSPPR